ncbi:MAG: BofC C-terminal domain-containing protein [Defluviitaleaceae bacterium]|nr:BofC C-terminal domain-containing protein [Defluviitaleaceae bacterium]
MENRKFYTALIGACTFSSVLGLMLGYFIFGPIGVSARTGEQPVVEEIPYIHYAEPYVKAEEQPEPSEEESYKFVVTSKDGVIVVYQGDRLKETTQTYVNALPIEEQERLAQGIPIYTEEALVRILEDYGS